MHKPKKLPVYSTSLQLSRDPSICLPSVLLSCCRALDCISNLICLAAAEGLAFTLLTLEVEFGLTAHTHGSLFVMNAARRA